MILKALFQTQYIDTGIDAKANKRRIEKKKKRKKK